MEEIQIRDALRHHVIDNEPPLGLSAAALLSKGRRRHRWRMGLTSGGTVTAIGLVASIALVPLGGSPSLESGCSVPVIHGYVAQPSTAPDNPSPWPTPDPSGEATPNPTNAPSTHPTNMPTAYPTYLPSPAPTIEPSPYPTDSVVIFPDPGWLTMAPTYPPDKPRMREMECYLKRELQRMAPGAKFAQFHDNDPQYGNGDSEPLAVYSVLDYRWRGRDGDRIYAASAVIVHPGQSIQFDISVSKPWEPPTGPESGWSFEKRGDVVVRHFRTREGMLMTEVYGPHSTIFAFATGTLLSPEQLIELSSATEMDMFR
ncbi:hypothetical protein Rhe02_76170 [Rhizocola hellebori]|uniref:Uncharacterized protein n=1 Tax=Rhizocola hellebori TaxID=1392758 RepID=A0A8J3VKA9_9ACTN|nr:hypothetical protein [Rhizocola hellebori]GIH09550.1 hypothetical protein Rhe02_76170 [Rhizocola hellebori]